MKGEIDFQKLYNTGIPKFTFNAHNLASVINSALFYVFAIAGFALLLYIIYGGFKWMTSGGNPDKLQAAKTTLTNSIIGFLIIFIAYWLIQLVGIAFGITEIQNTFKPIGP